MQAGQISVLAFWLATGLYVIATVLYGYTFAVKRATLSRYATFATGIGFVTHTVSIAMRWAEAGSFPFHGPYESLSLTAWAIVLIYFIVEHLAKIKVLGTALTAAAFLAMAIAALTFEAPKENIDPVTDGIRVTIHVALIMLSNAGFAIAAASGLIYVIQEGQLKRHSNSLLLKRLPSLASADSLARRAVLWALPAFTAGMLLGVIRAIQFDVAFWWFDPRVMLAGITWAVFSTYLYMRFKTSVSGRHAAYVLFVGMVLVVANATLARTLPAGFHIFGQS